MANTSKIHNNDGDTQVIEAGGVLDVKTGGIIKANGTQASHIVNIANDANGTAIATAVNAILAALEGAGIIKAS